LATAGGYLDLSKTKAERIQFKTAGKGVGEKVGLETAELCAPCLLNGLLFHGLVLQRQGPSLEPLHRLACSLKLTTGSVLSKTWSSSTSASLSPYCWHAMAVNLASSNTIFTPLLNTHGTATHTLSVHHSPSSASCRITRRKMTHGGMGETTRLRATPRSTPPAAEKKTPRES